MSSRGSAFVLAAMVTTLAASGAQAQIEVAATLAAGDAALAALNLAAATAAYRSAHETAPASYEAAWKLARALSDGATLATDPGQQKTLCVEAEKLARLAVRLAPADSKGHAYLAVAVGKLALYEGGKRKVELSKEVKAEADEALRLNPDEDVALHVLAIWNREMVELGWLLKGVAELLYGRFPAASLDAALASLRRAVLLAPEVIPHHVELGITLASAGRWADARAELERALALPTGWVTDDHYRRLARQHLAKVRKRLRWAATSTPRCFFPPAGGVRVAAPASGDRYNQRVVTRQDAMNALAALRRTVAGDRAILVGSSGLLGLETEVAPLTEDVDIAIPAAIVEQQGASLVAGLAEEGFAHLAGSATFVGERDGVGLDLLGYGHPAEGDHIAGGEPLRVMVFSDLSRLLAMPAATQTLPGGARALTAAGFVACKLLTERGHKGAKDKLQALLVLAERGQDPGTLADLRALLREFEPERLDDLAASAQEAFLSLAGDPLFRDGGAEGYAPFAHQVEAGFRRLQDVLVGVGG
ncbi:MAG: hypothetical protein V1750_08265 [Acidobacteriota bacterium]